MGYAPKSRTGVFFAVCFALSRYCPYHNIELLLYYGHQSRFLWSAEQGKKPRQKYGYISTPGQYFLDD